MRKLINWFKNWLELRERHDFNRGYDWAAGELLRSSGTAASSLEAHVEIAASFSDSMPFDHGVTAALKDWEAHA